MIDRGVVEGSEANKKDKHKDKDKYEDKVNYELEYYGKKIMRDMGFSTRGATLELKISVSVRDLHPLRLDEAKNDAYNFIVDDALDIKEKLKEKVSIEKVKDWDGNY